MNAQDKQHLAALIHSARIVLREVGALAAEAEDFRQKFSPNSGIATARNACVLHAYDMACAHLTQLDPVGAAEFIRSTYGPPFRPMEVTK